MSGKYTNDWAKMELAIANILGEDPELAEYLEHEENLPFPVIHLTTLTGETRRWGVDVTEVYVYKESNGDAKYFGVTWYKYLGDSEGDPDWRLDLVDAVTEPTTRYVLIA